MPDQSAADRADLMSFDEIATALRLPRRPDGRILEISAMVLRRLFEQSEKYFTPPDPCLQIEGSWYIRREHLPRVRAALTPKDGVYAQWWQRKFSSTR